MSKFLLRMYEMYKFSTLNFFKVTCVCTCLVYLFWFGGGCVCVCMCETVRESVYIYIYQAWELSAKMRISAALKLTFRREKQLSVWKRNQQYKKKKGSTGFSSALNTPRNMRNVFTYGNHPSWSRNSEHRHSLLLSWAGNRLECSHSYTLLRCVSAKKK